MKKLILKPRASVEDIAKLYEKLTGRRPTRAEMDAARDVLEGSRPTIAPKRKP